MNDFKSALHGELQLCKYCCIHKSVPSFCSLISIEVQYCPGGSKTLAALVTDTNLI